MKGDSFIILIRMFQGKKCPCIFLTILENKFSPAHSVESKFSYTETE